MEKKNKKSIVIGITVLLLVTLTLLGLTYAYYRTRIVGNTNPNSVSVTSKKIEVTYGDGSSSITLNSQVSPGDSFTKAFTVTNTGEGAAYYSIVIDNMTNTFQRDKDWTYTLTEGGSEVSEGTIAVGTHQILVAKDSLASGSAEYVLTVTYANPEDIDQSEDMGSELSFRVNISDENPTWENPEAPSWAEEGATTLLSAIKTNNASVIKSTTTSVPGQAATAATEAEIGSTQDDYGTSYYFRGMVENNYVTYSGMCWRVVRVQGDGTIKLALADYEHACGTTEETGYDTADTDSAFVDDGNGNARKNIAYKASASYTTADMPFANSDIPLVLSTWASDKKLDTSNLVEAEWCNDTAVKSKSSYGYNDNYDTVYNESEATNGWYTDLNYGAYKRLSSVASAEPSLKCNQEGEDSTKATRYKNILGVLSADEVAFAGSTSYQSGTTYNYYLKTNATGKWYWSLSPYFVSTGYYSFVWVVNTSGFLSDYGVHNSIGSVRPAVVLRSDVTIKAGGNGTLETPYEIN